jgi:alpha-L-fucosidase 2
MQQLYSHYEYGLDKDYLKRIYPLLKGSSQFFLDFLIKDPVSGWFVTCPSTSPENCFYTKVGEQASVSMGSSMDNQIIRDLFRNMIEATVVLQCDQDFQHELINALEKLPPHQIGEYGQLQEWLFDFEEVEVQHRHLSHLYACYPDDDITLRKNPGLAEAVKVVLKRRGDTNLGWSGAWKLNLLARLEEAEDAYSILKKMITAVSLHPQPDDSDITPSFEGNQGIQGVTAGIAEMLMQSHSNEISLLPALPSVWDDGKVTGLRGKGGFVVDIEWKSNKLHKAILHSEYDNECQLRTKIPVKILSDWKFVSLIKTSENSYRFRTSRDKNYVILPK